MFVKQPKAWRKGLRSNPMPGEYDYGLDPGKFRAEVDAANRRVDAVPDGLAASAIDKAILPHTSAEGVPDA